MRTDIADKLPVPAPHWSPDDWRLPFGLAIAVHILALLLVILSPYFHSRQPIIDVQTVNLFTAAEVEQPPAPKKIAKPAAAPPKVPAKKPAAPEPAVSKHAVSLRPLKSKTKRAEDDLKAKETILERKLRQVQAAVAKEQAEKEVRKEVDSALEKIRQSYASSNPSSPVSQSDASELAEVGNRGAGSVEVSEAKKRYYAAIQMHLSRYWTLPESHDWKENLEVVAVLWFLPNGRIIKRAFERKSENEFFNRFVQATLEKVETVPPVPLDLPSREAEQILNDGIGFRFHPSGIY